MSSKITIEKRREYDRKYRQESRYYVDRRVRDYFRSIIRGKVASSKYEEILGYSAEDLKKHLISLFDDRMRFDNFGEWHVDHKKGRMNFDYNSFDCEGFRTCYALSNLQPLMKIDNLKKKKIDESA